MRKYKIAIDVMGSDNGPQELVQGALETLGEHEELELLLVGDEAVIKGACEGCAADMSRVEILHADEVITNYDSPAVALFEKRNSSLVKALSALAARDDIDALINAGSTGALIAGSMRYLPTADRVRPALAATFPAERGGVVCLVDTGATIDCGAQTLLHFARLGSAFMKERYNIDSPKVGLLSNGREETKGNKVVKEAHGLLAAEESLNFVGNIEGNNALSGDCDVLVCDGFAGNQVLKVTEGTARRIITDIVRFARKTGNESCMALVAHLMGIYGMDTNGGGIILGVRKLVIKAHGAADKQALKGVINMTLTLAKNKDLSDKKA